MSLLSVKGSFTNLALPLSANCLVLLHTTVMLTIYYINRQPARGYQYSESQMLGARAPQAKMIVKIDNNCSPSYHTQAKMIVKIDNNCSPSYHTRGGHDLTVLFPIFFFRKGRTEIKCAGTSMLEYSSVLYCIFRSGVVRTELPKANTNFILTNISEFYVGHFNCISSIYMRFFILEFYVACV